MPHLRWSLVLICPLIGCAPTAVDEPGVRSREEPAAPIENTSRQATFAGLWDTTYGTMRLELEGARVTGWYSYGDGASVEGAVVEDRLLLDYREADGTVGKAIFRLDPTGERFDGVWRAGEGVIGLDDAALARWTGERVVSVPGRRWLVILEVHWEESLREREYSYGWMLRSFFERMPDVAVRHRFVHDRADLVRFLNEVAHLPEPAVVYISSHGSPHGVQASDGVIDGKTIGAALRAARNIDLLHFGACSVLRGDLAEQVRTANAPAARFPISGYRRDADWAGSAIVDFAYLDMIFEHDMTPQDAVAEVRRSLEFATDSKRADAAIAAIDLVIQ
jgi:hypothetical protein